METKKAETAKSTNKDDKKFKWETLLISLLIITMGILFIALPNETGNLICTLLGIFLIVGAAIGLVSLIFNSQNVNLGNTLVWSIICLIFGIFCFTNRADVQDLIVFIFGILIIVNGVVAVAQGLNSLQARDKSGIIVAIIGLILTALGCVVLFGTFSAVSTLAGIALIIDGVFNIVTLFFAKNVVKTTNKIVFVQAEKEETIKEQPKKEEKLEVANNEVETPKKEVANNEVETPKKEVAKKTEKTPKKEVAKKETTKKTATKTTAKKTTTKTATKKTSK